MNYSNPIQPKTNSKNSPIQQKSISKNSGRSYHNYNSLVAAIAQQNLTDCLEILESKGIPPDLGISLLPLIQAEMVGGIQ